MAKEKYWTREKAITKLLDASGDPKKIDAWNDYRRQHLDWEPDLREADLSEANLFRTDFSRADLGGADLIGTNFSGADLSGANLDGADFSGANLREADLSEADLSFANLSNADLRKADLSWADLRWADFINANLSGVTLSGADLSAVVLGSTTLGGIDLSQTKGLELIKHLGPSTIGVDTLIRSKGKIPEEFLRGCGVPDAMIEYLPSIIGSMSPIQFYSCFISYSHKDEAFCKRLHGRMEQAGLRVWYADENMKGGQKIHEQIDQAIRKHDKLLLVLSPQSMNSPWVETEIHKARQREVREGRRVLFPIRLCDIEQIRGWKCFDADTGKDLAREVREYFIPDFSNWKDHDAFEASFERLLNDFKASTDESHQ